MYMQHKVRCSNDSDMITHPQDCPAMVVMQLVARPVLDLYCDAQIAKEESQLDFKQSATALHNKIRAFTGWPGTFGCFVISSNDDLAGGQKQQIKILQSRVLNDAADVQLGQDPQAATPGQVVFAANGSRMLVPCGGASVLEVLLLQTPTKKAMSPQAFYNGLRGKQVYVSQS